MRSVRSMAPPAESILRERNGSLKYWAGLERKENYLLRGINDPGRGRVRVREPLYAAAAASDVSRRFTIPQWPRMGIRHLGLGRVNGSKVGVVTACLAARPRLDPELGIERASERTRSGSSGFYQRLDAHNEDRPGRSPASMVKVCVRYRSEKNERHVSGRRRKKAGRKKVGDK